MLFCIYPNFCACVCGLECDVTFQLHLIVFVTPRAGVFAWACARSHSCTTPKIKKQTHFIKRKEMLERDVSINIRMPFIRFDPGAEASTRKPRETAGMIWYKRCLDDTEHNTHSFSPWMWLPIRPKITHAEEAFFIKQLQLSPVPEPSQRPCTQLAMSSSAAAVSQFFISPGIADEN